MVVESEIHVGKFFEIIFSIFGALMFVVSLALVISSLLLCFSINVTVYIDGLSC